MIKKIVLLLLFVFTFTNATEGERTCYMAEKKDLNITGDLVLENISIGTYDILFSFPKIKGTYWLNLYFLSDIPVPYADYGNSFYCMTGDAKTSCSQDDDGGKILIRFDEDKLYYKFKSARLTNTTDDPIIRLVNNQKDKEYIARKIPCPKHNEFKDKKESILPYVCYSKSGGGCIRYHKTCKKLGLQKYGEYPNNYEAFQAREKCTEWRFSHY